MNKLSLLPFPQRVVGDVIHFNVLVLPVDQAFDPLAPLAPGADAFAEANIQLEARVISGLQTFPSLAATTLPAVSLPLSAPAGDVPAMYTTLGAQFNVSPAYHKPPQVRANFFTKKYLPGSYREAFNFHRPMTADAVLDDSYHCAVRDKKGPNPAFVADTNQVSWGKVIAYCLRHPLLARRMGLIYETTLPIDETWFENGGYLYVDLAEGSSYRNELLLDPTFVKRYAARIPALAPGDERALFAPVLFPVLIDNPPVPEGNYDAIFIEAGQYDDGFAKIVHLDQPRSADPLVEDDDPANPPVYDQGIRLAWDDEQVLAWLNRQMRKNPDNPMATRPLDAPNGVSAYRVDVRPEGEAAWRSLVRVQSKTDLAVGNENLGTFTGELGVEVHPTQLDGYQDESHFWLPHYFSVWNGQSLVLPDEQAAEIYQLPQSSLGAGSANLGRLYNPAGLEGLNLTYGNRYDFRVRLADITGGGPAGDDEPEYEAPAPVASCHFRRFIPPEALRLPDLPDGKEVYEPAGGTLRVDRPLLGYPAVVYTGKYDDVYNRLKQASLDATAKDSFGLPDPDVLTVQVVVEVETLKMDTADSVSGRENYIHYYTTTRPFPAAFDGTLEIPLNYQDARVLDFSDPLNPGKDIMGVTLADVHAQAGLPLPTARNLRITLRALGDGDPDYYGTAASHTGRPVQFVLRREPATEEDLYIDAALATQIQGIYLQPDPPPVFDGRLTTLLFSRRGEEKPADLIQRLANQMGLQNKGLSLLGAPGRRVRFGCSRAIRHTLSPEHGSVTFAAKGELLNHWLVVLRLDLDRDWTWDALADRGIDVLRTMKFRSAPANLETGALAGDIELTRTAALTELTDPERGRTTLIFIDAVEPKPAQAGFPDIIELTYALAPHFRNPAVAASPHWTAQLSLPVTTPPAQVPKIVSAGVALSPYQRDETYANTSPRRRQLWLEFEEPIADPNDALFARVLANAPDPLLADGSRGELYVAPQEPALPVDAELIRVITPGQSDDLAGLNAMQRLEKAADSDRHYLLPLPPGMNPDSKELFGFFTYEFRVGHAAIWSTAQGRFGRPLRTTGVQHPAPALFCNVNRDNEKLYVNAPYAQAVHQGRNVTARPPRTEIWCLLYAQVHQADGKDHRNILLDERLLKLIDRQKYFGNPKDKTPVALNRDRTPVGITGWTNEQVTLLLRRLGLPADSPLSVLCVEMMPRLSSYVREPESSFAARASGTATPGAEDGGRQAFNTLSAGPEPRPSDGIRPLSDQLGHYRILRTSKLTAVPEVCCC